MTATGTAILMTLIPVILFGSRRWALLGFAVGTLYLTQGEPIEVFGFHLYAVRFLELFGILRVIVRHEFNFSNLNSIDRPFLCLYIYTTIVFALRSTEGLSYQMGSAVDATLSYFVFRGLIPGINDLKWFLKRFAVLLIPYFILVLIERLTIQNPFALLGAIATVSDFRDGIPRCTGSFRHAILLGSFGAAFLPIYIGLFFEKGSKNIALIGVGTCLGIVFLSNSGGPVSSAAIALLGWGCWVFKRNLRFVRLGIIYIFVSLAMFMKAPIWALPFKISEITGGGGWHRYYLIDVAIKAFNEWWIAGMSITKTREWFPYYLNTGGADITNEFIAFGLDAGIMAIIIFVYLLVKGFKVIGKGLEINEISINPDSGRFIIWGLGVMIVVHVSNWFGVNYFDQLKYFWYMHIAIIAMLADSAKIVKSKPLYPLTQIT